MSYASEQAVLNNQWNAAQEANITEQDRRRPFILLRPAIFPDGDQWCCLLGDDLMVGIAGFGDTPEAASRDFDHAWFNGKTPRAIQLERAKAGS